MVGNHPGLVDYHEALISLQLADVVSYESLRDRSNGIIPTHIPNNNVFIAHTCNGCDVVKIGKRINIHFEYTYLSEVYRIFANRDTAFRVPCPIAVFDIDDLSILRMSYSGTKILESCLLTHSIDEIINTSINALAELYSLDIVWLSAAPKNIVIPDEEDNDKRYTILDWERGYIRPGNIADRNDQFYKRCIQLHEEWVQIKQNIYPYWSNTFPALNELERHSGSKCIIASFNLLDSNSRREQKIRELCALPAVVTDAQYYRLNNILSSLSGEYNGHPESVVYATDLLSEIGGTSNRVELSMLFWYLTLAGNERCIRALTKVIIELGIQIEDYQRRCSYDHENSSELLSKLKLSTNNILAEFGEKKLTERKLIGICADYVLNGNCSPKEEAIILQKV